MKKYFTLLIFSLFISQVNAQLEAGRIYTTGFGSIYHSNDKVITSGTGILTTTLKGTKEFNGKIGLGAGYFLTKHIAVGGNVHLNTHKIQFNDTSNRIDKYRIMGLGLSARYYITIASNFYFYGSLGYAIGFQKYTNMRGQVTDVNPKVINQSIGISPGFTWFASDNFAFNASWGFLGLKHKRTRTTNSTSETTFKQNELMANFGLSQINFGVMVFID
ncbi:MAG: outer membrane beta-barrel protein [Bacteroidetes bacterium]|nr:outer membrane beta-barrel protein [Bacteroidota bacterium]